MGGRVGEWVVVLGKPFLMSTDAMLHDEHKVQSGRVSVHHNRKRRHEHLLLHERAALQHNRYLSWQQCYYVAANDTASSLRPAATASATTQTATSLVFSD